MHANHPATILGRESRGRGKGGDLTRLLWSPGADMANFKSGLAQRPKVNAALHWLRWGVMATSLSAATRIRQDDAFHHGITFTPR